MIADVDLDRIIATWIADGPERAPRDRVAAALAEVSSTRQRRLWLRPILGDADERGSLRSPLAVAIVLALLVAAGLAVGIGAGLIRLPSAPPPPAVTADVELRQIEIADWSARVSIPTTWTLVGDPSQLSEWRRFTGTDPEGELSVSHESPYQVTLCDPGCQVVKLPRPIPFSATTVLDALKAGVQDVAGSGPWRLLPPQVLSELEGGARSDVDREDDAGRAWRHVYVVGLRGRNAVAIAWRQPVDSFDRALLDAVLTQLELPRAPVYSDGDLVATASEAFELPMPGFWTGEFQPNLDGIPLSGVRRFADGRVMVSIGDRQGAIGLCDPDCRRLTEQRSMDALERSIREAHELGPTATITLGGEPARSMGTDQPIEQRYVVAMHRDRPVILLIDVGGWDVADGIIDDMVAGFRFLDPEPPPAARDHTTPDGRMILRLTERWRESTLNIGTFAMDHLGREQQQLTVTVGDRDGSIRTCDKPAGPWELCRNVIATTLAQLRDAVQPAPITDHGVGPPVATNDDIEVDAERGVVTRIRAYEYPARGGQEVVYILAMHDGRPYIVRIWTSRNEAAEVGQIIQGIRFVD
jgi:hypothetical protein